MLFSSTCSMKTMLWEQLGIEKPVTTKSYSSKGIFFQNQSDSFVESCTANIGSLFDEADVLPGTTVKAPLLLLFVLLILSFALPGLLQIKSNSNFHFSYSDSGKVPIYLRQGQLIYYS